MSSITVSKHLESDTLHLPELLPLVGHQVEIVVRDADPIMEQSGDRKALRGIVEQISKTCEIPKWDGGHAEPISRGTLEMANQVFESIPTNIPLPTISPELDGHLNFKWHQAPRRLLTVSLSGSGMLYWAALIGSEDPRGSCPFVDRFPKTLLYWISQVFE